MKTRTPPKLSNITRLRFNGLVKVYVVGNKRSPEQSQQLNADLQQMQVTGQHQDRLHWVSQEIGGIKNSDNPCFK
ncbi:hypothetical protein ROHU_025079 [Labeo rohita]|nr:hypothetical protein ROHU_011021 [Labeo rohita]RXN20220.1 hypothetical protein ROHU_025079 [Labeo rohita]